MESSSTPPKNRDRTSTKMLARCFLHVTRNVPDDSGRKWDVVGYLRPRRSRRDGVATGAANAAGSHTAVLKNNIDANAFQTLTSPFFSFCHQKLHFRVAVISAKNHKRQRRKRQSVIAKRGKSQTPKVLTAILTLPNLT